ncbi:MAG: DUF4433 domain-containing protein [Gammaproteobacteria bacterium]|nr:DUF4433 domain-containing protein [Gammaproteobacteria bacterium]MDE0301936.1 DUF4433 domain-containing protein [Gammaproteobacteria bacterium]
MLSPPDPKIYHIVHVDRLSSIIDSGCLLCDSEVEERRLPGTTIGIPDLKQQRMSRRLHSRPGLSVGDCVPFYFCPRSVMLYIIYRANRPGLVYRDGQGPIVHLEADFRETVAWAEEERRRWAFTKSNASSLYCEDFCDLDQLDEIDWNAVSAHDWHDCKENKQAEFLVEGAFPWKLVQRIGVCTEQMAKVALRAVQFAQHRPAVQVNKNWYY